MKVQRVYKTTAYNMDGFMTFRFSVVADSVAHAETKVMEHIKEHHKAFLISDVKAESKYTEVWI